jgi:hypothetical protein
MNDFASGAGQGAPRADEVLYTRVFEAPRDPCSGA